VIKFGLSLSLWVQLQVLRQVDELLLSSRDPEAWRIVFIIMRCASSQNPGSWGKFRVDDASWQHNPGGSPFFFSLPNHTLIDVASTLFTMIRPRKRLEGPRKLEMIRVGQLVPTLRRIAQEFKPTQNQNVEVSKQKQRPWCPNQKTSILGCNNRQTPPADTS
jgi:hypothetical protein